ncbi:MAG: ABC transporter ATP-binding protein [Bacilli bacterium]|nr:ABC transporter ATP-binding protein [Bacilli bacterium]
MNEMLRIENLKKKYPSFSLKGVSFDIKPGQIMGFIGRNGAGKTTTLKCVMNLVHYDSGSVYAFDKDMTKNELECKQRIGFALSELNYYPNKTIRQLMNVTKRFYKQFDDHKFEEACRLFNLDVNKKLEELSSGMKVKFSVAIALSHNAELLILDEPTSGLDPVSREEILDLFRDLVKKKDRAILFSTHITSDLDKCASDITYIHDGEIIYTGTKKGFIDSYMFVKDKTSNKSLTNDYISYKEFEDHIEGLISPRNKDKFIKNGIEPVEPDLEQIMIYLERSKDGNESFDL